MGDKNKSNMTRSVTENLSRDFLTRFMGSEWREEFGAKKDEVYIDEEEKIELNLGLSLGGRFGIEKDSNTLIRSSSIAECFPIVRDENDALTVSPPPVAYSRLMRTTSLPLETEEWRKRKELQTIRRMEAKRRRTEKQRNAKDEGSSGVAQMQDEKKEVIDLNLRGRIEKDRLLTATKQIDRVTLPFRTYAWDVFGSIPPKGGNGTGAAIAKGKATHEFISQGSAELQGGSSSSDLDNRSLPGSGGCDTSPASNQDVGSSGTKTKGIMGKTSSLEVENPSNEQSDMTRSQVREARTSALEDMPCVFTKGNGPNGRRVDGILYQYGKGEEVRIMCVCHGNFHSPAEFVKHAGGTDFTHPLRHIVVNPNSAPFM